jgi:nucleotide-binding universal stress UspA family protein
MDAEITLAPGAEIDGFRLVDKIAVGGMGAVWRVERPGETMPLVMKTPFLKGGADVSTIIGYETEEMVLKRLTGRHVPHFVAAGDLRRRPYLVMEFVAGETLESRLDDKPVDAETAARYGALIAEALDSLHRQGVVHLDLKPGNVILAERGAVLIDFGLARHEKLPDLLGEESDVPMGTPATISPEQLCGDRTRPESDIFALGVILYRLVTGEYPFDEPVSLAGQKRRLYRPPRPPASLNGKVPRWMQEIVLRCLEVDPADRYASAAQLMFDLNHPEQVGLTERAERAGESGLGRRLVALLRGRDLGNKPPARLAPSRRVSSAPLLVAAVDLAGGADALALAVRDHVVRVLETEKRARLACLTVLRTRLVGEDPERDRSGRSPYVSRLVALKDWAHPLALEEDRVSFHVLEAVDPGSAILDYVRLNRVDHVVMGARASSALRRHLGSVSSAVVAEAACTVTVVRLKEPDASPAEAGSGGIPVTRREK